MTASPSSSSGLEVLLSTLQNAGDVESSLNILNVLDELLSAGTDRRIQYMIGKGGSEALLTALVNTGRSFSPNYTILLPLLHLLAKVGQRDRRIGRKAVEAGAVLLTLNLLKDNVNHARRAAACLWVIQVFSASVSTANLLGENHGLDVIYRLIPQYTTKHLLTIKAAINAFAALLCTMMCGQYIYKYSGYKKSTQPLFKCQTCLLNKARESLVEPSVQLIRKCLPRTRLPLTSNLSAYTFPLPGRPYPVPSDMAPDDSSMESDDEEAEDNQEADSKDYVIKWLSKPNDYRTLVQLTARLLLEVLPEVTGQTKSGSQAHHEQKNIKDRYVARIRIGVTGPHPGARPEGLGLAGERLVAGSLPTGTRPGSARNGDVGPLPVGSPPAGRSMRGRCNVVWVAVVAGGLDDPIPGPKLWQ
ncbi:hypothetical protein L3Q82_007404 [Scortum barcoo]|uniref:Uncharacterized protein n=1 Tax=Scortum barcoo TaxID=214431 RepID=A0ACB8WS75_9TELE|nr:hypothetical protein L3Q82_007404 [Scortum barcoo]